MEFGSFTSYILASFSFNSAFVQEQKQSKLTEKQLRKKIRKGFHTMTQQHIWEGGIRGTSGSMLEGGVSMDTPNSKKNKII